MCINLSYAIIKSQIRSRFCTHSPMGKDHSTLWIALLTLHCFKSSTIYPLLLMTLPFIASQIHNKNKQGLQGLKKKLHSEQGSLKVTRI